MITLANVKATAQPSNARGSAMGVSLDAANFYNSTACPAHAGQIELEFISSRTKEALAKRKAAGMKLVFNSNSY